MLLLLPPGPAAPRRPLLLFVTCCEAQIAAPPRAGKAHDVMALKCRGAGSPLNFGLDEYGDLVPMLPQLSKVRASPHRMPLLAGGQMRGSRGSKRHAAAAHCGGTAQACMHASSRHAEVLGGMLLGGIAPGAPWCHCGAT